MRKTSLLKPLFLLFALIVGLGSAWAQSDYSTDYTGNVTLSTYGGTKATACVIKISNTDYNGIKAGTTSAAGAMLITVPSGTKYLHLHLAGWNGETVTLGVTPTGYSDDISLTANSGISGNSPFTFSGDPSTSDYYKVITFESALTADTELTFTATSGKRFVVWGVTAEEDGGSDTPTPSITADNVSIAYNATSGSIAYTISNPVQGGSVSASVPSGSWLTLGSGTASPISFTCSANEETTARTETVTLTYTYNTDATVTKNVTVTQAAATVAYSTIPNLFAAATSTATDVNVTFDNWVVSGVSTNGKNVFVTDNNGNGFVIYSSSNQSNTYSVGNILSGTVSCKLQLYNGFAEITNLNASDLTITTGGTVSAANIELANLAGVNTGALVSYTDLTCSVDNNKYYLSDGTTTLQVYNALYAFGTLTADKKYNITGIYQQFNNTKEILPRSAADIEEVTSTEPVINANDVELEWDATSGEIAYTITNPVSNPTTFGAMATVDWITDVEMTAGKVTFNTTQNDGNADRTADITIRYENAEKIVKVTQKHYVADYAELPFEFNGGKADIENTAGLTQSGLGSDYSSSPKLKFDGAGDWLILKINERPGTLTFVIKGNSFSGGTFTVQTSEDGETYTDLKNYTELGNNQTEVFNSFGENVRYIKWVYTAKDQGNVALGNITVSQLSDDPLITIDPTTYNVPYTESDGTIEVTYNNMIEVEADVILYGGDGEPKDYDWITVEIDNDKNVYYHVDENTTDEERTAYLRVMAVGEDTPLVFSDMITITQAKYVDATTYTLATSVVPGKHYIIVGEKNGTYYAMGAQNNNNRAAVEVEVTANGNTVTGAEGVCEFVIYGPENERYSIYDEKEFGYLHAASSSSNYLRTQTVNDDNGRWTIEFDSENGFASIVANGSYTRKVMQFNSSSTLFACYGADSQSPVYLYEKDGEADPTGTVSISTKADRKYATCVTTQTLDFSAAEGITAYIATGLNSAGDAVVITPVDYVPVNTPILVKTATKGATVEVPVRNLEPNDVSENKFVAGDGTTDVTTVTDITYYYLASDEFHEAIEGTLQAGKAYLAVPKSSAGAHTLNISFDNSETTGISAVENVQMTDGNVYNRNGQRVAQPTKGLYIVNGKLVIIK